jgi:hypothetical protein
MARYYTREEAEALLPQISVILQAIQQERAAMVECEDQLGALEARARGNGHHLAEKIGQAQRDLAQHLQALRALAVELDDFDIELKDPETGLIDFLSLRDGREVYLCWKLGEKGIKFWHELDTGFSGRQPL